MVASVRLTVAVTVAVARALSMLSAGSLPVCDAVAALASDQRLCPCILLALERAHSITLGIDGLAHALKLASTNAATPQRRPYAAFAAAHASSCDGLAHGAAADHATTHNAATPQRRTGEAFDDDHASFSSARRDGANHGVHGAYSSRVFTLLPSRC